MSSDEKVLDFPRVEVTSEENARRVMVEATRLASLAPGEWRLWIDRSAERLRIPRAILEDVIAAIIKDSEKKARDAETEARRHRLGLKMAGGLRRSASGVLPRRLAERRSRYCTSSPNDPGVSAERNAVIMAKKAVKRIRQSSSQAANCKVLVVGGSGRSVDLKRHDGRAPARSRATMRRYT